MNVLTVSAVFYVLSLEGRIIKGEMSIKSKRPPQRQPNEYQWDGERVKALREHLGMTQAEFAAELGVLQQTVSLWERGYHSPKGASARLLTLLAEKAKFKHAESR